MFGLEAKVGDPEKQRRFSDLVTADPDEPELLDGNIAEFYGKCLAKAGLVPPKNSRTFDPSHIHRVAFDPPTPRVLPSASSKISGPRMNELNVIPHRPTGARSALAGKDWQYIEAPILDDFNSQDWETLNRQRTHYNAEQQASQALRLLTASRDDTTFGYQINNYEHCLQAATMALRDGLNEETIVVALLHDVGFITCPTMHGEFAAALLGAYISERNYWMLRRHAIFQLHHCRSWPDLNYDERERWRGHPHFEWTAEFVDRYDQNSIQAGYENAPIEEFIPLV